MASQYAKSDLSGVASFEVEPASAPIPIFELIYLTAITAFAFSLSAKFGLVFAAVFFAFVIFTMWVSPSAMKHRSRASFTAGPDGVAVGGQTIPKEAIHRLIVRNHVNGAESSSVVFIGGNAASQAMGGLAMAGAALKNKRMRKLSEVSYRLDVESGGRAVTLAGGLDDATAFGLMKDVGAALGM